MKRCSSCHVERPIIEFSWRNKAKGTRQSRCKDCFRRFENEKYQTSKEERARKNRNRKNFRLDKQELVFNYLKENPCVDCGEDDPVVLEFDHRSDKTQSVSIMLRDQSRQTIMDEIAKCDVRCANCHRRKTAKDFNWWKLNWV